MWKNLYLIHCSFDSCFIFGCLQKFGMSSFEREKVHFKFLGENEAIVTGFGLLNEPTIYKLQDEIIRRLKYINLLQD